MRGMIDRLNKIAKPQDILARYIVSKDTICFTFEFSHLQSYLSGSDEIELSVACIQCESKLLCIIKESSKAASTAHLNINLDPEDYFNKIETLWGQKGINLQTLWRLETVRIAKPWGSEIWYTGMEDRGISSVAGMPLPWLCSIMPNRLAEDLRSTQATRQSNLILLKILDPFPEVDRGDLYFELHSEKREVYIVTSIDEASWPNGEGQIRYGFNQEKLNTFDTALEFKSAYLASVETYQSVRNEIDNLLDTQSEKTPIPSELVAKEQKLKDIMYDFTALKHLKVGDVIHVHPYFPHSLQHGVRVIEFQTAHYERYILSFTQKVLTQNHWDTKTALEKVQTNLPTIETLKIIENTAGVLFESIADFEEFSAYRLSLQKNASYVSNTNAYTIVIGVKGECLVEDSLGNAIHVRAEESFLIPPLTKEISIKGRTDNSVLLLAVPR